MQSEEKIQWQARWRKWAKFIILPFAKRRERGRDIELSACHRYSSNVEIVSTATEKMGVIHYPAICEAERKSNVKIVFTEVCSIILPQPSLSLIAPTYATIYTLSSVIESFADVVHSE
ncbi:hypothetical protein CDAR_289801 [Caerostris darwini]|uniref:Uncharacterized protein n=1 Tax=Caerostris darwini TaxID=1538125 RepID=A0AAV4WWR3_9ARAC|nr:hypothetical protein CDAR_289801 [Caerostris darwini]